MDVQGEGRTYGAKGNGGRSQTDQAAVAGMGLVYNVGIVIAQLVEDGLNAVEVLGGDELAYDPFQPSRGDWRSERLGLGSSPR